MRDPYTAMYRARQRVFPDVLWFPTVGLIFSISMFVSRPFGGAILVGVLVAVPSIVTLTLVVSGFVKRRGTATSQRSSVTEWAPPDPATRRG